MNDIESKKGNFLMRRIEYTPDFVNIYCDIKIKWLQDIYFESIINMPYVLLNEKKFEDIQIFKRHISINIEEWNAFFLNIVSAFRNNEESRKTIIKNVNEVLHESEIFVNKIYKNVYTKGYVVTFEELQILFEYFNRLDSFAVFNMLIPYRHYSKLIKELNIPSDYSIDDLMICSFIPHRLQVRKNKLLLLKEFMEKNEDIDESIKKYILDYAVYEQFENIAFDNEFLKNDAYLRRELKRMSKEYSIKDIDFECTKMNENREKQKEKMNSFINLVNERTQNNQKVVETLSFLILIVSEEEKRHMIECKIFAILCEVFKYEKIDISRSSMKDILDTYKFLKGEK